MHTPGMKVIDPETPWAFHIAWNEELSDGLYAVSVRASDEQVANRVTAILESAGRTGIRVVRPGKGRPQDRSPVLVQVKKNRRAK